jgi:hypothetical protein
MHSPVNSRVGSQATGVAGHDDIFVRTILSGRDILAAGALPEFESKDVELLFL